MAQSKQQIQSILASVGGKPRRRFGQNFMIDQNLVRIVADAGIIHPRDIVIEIGPGTGTLTEELLARAGRVIAVEIDRDLAAALRDRFGSEANFELIEGDALDGKHALHPTLAATLTAAANDPHSVKLVANLPYNIASPLIVELLLAGVDLLAFTVQREVADRMRAGAGEEAYGPLSVITQLLGQVEVLRTLPPTAFWPAPNVDSALVRIRRQAQPPCDPAEARRFSRFVHDLFSYRRKTLRRALVEAGCHAEEVLQQTGFDGALRPEVFTPPQLLSMFRAARRR